jgi:tRNA(Ser,Leu) C12 N-acetylase TAN1
VSQDRSAPPTRHEARLETCNLLVSFGSRAPGRAGREIRGRLRALGDPEPVTGPTLSRGILAARTRLDPRAAIRELRAVCRASPEAFRHTTRWVPVDVWTAPELGEMCEAGLVLAGRIGFQEPWRMTVEKRAGARLDPQAVIRALAALVSAPVNLAHPEKILLVNLFGDAVALSVLAPDEILSVAALRGAAEQAGGIADGTGNQPG